MAEPAGGARILVVDDHAESRRTMQDALQLSGLACTGAADAREALELCAGERFACMLLDEVLGEDSGLSLAAQLHAAPASRPRRIVMVSGLAPQFFEEAIRDGVIDGFLEKPVTLDELLARVDAVSAGR